MRGENIIAVVLLIVFIGVASLFITFPVGRFIGAAGQACYDSDVGENIYTKGYVRYSEARLHPEDACKAYEGTDEFWDCAQKNIRTIEISDEDHCIDDTTLVELSCNENRLGVGKARNCPNGCGDGKCI